MYVRTAELARPADEADQAGQPVQDAQGERRQEDEHGHQLAGVGEHAVGHLLRQSREGKAGAVPDHDPGNGRLPPPRPPGTNQKHGPGHGNPEPDRRDPTAIHQPS
jgi:hypothetical protein